MKLTNKIALISGLGCLALVGTGFAAWTYADANNIENNNLTQTAAYAGTGTTTTTQTNLKGTISVENKAYLFLDEFYKIDSGKLVANTNGGKIQGVALWAGTDVLASAIEDSDSNANKVLVAASMIPTLTMSDGTAAPSYLTYTWTFVATGNITNYVTFSNVSGNWTSGSSITLPTATFNQANAPQSVDEYNTMISNIAGSALTFTFTVA